MSLIAPVNSQWKLNQIGAGPPYMVDIVGPYRLPQVCDMRGTVAVVGPNGAVFCASHEEAKAVCDAANAGELEQQSNAS